jgi:hydrogenase maturation factor HypF (carbamoyltransferase family)
MPKYQYTIKGTPYQKIDLKQELAALVSKHALSLEVRAHKTRFILEIEGEEKALHKIEPELLKTVISLINIHSYVKKESHRRDKEFTSKNSDAPANATEQNVKKSIQHLSRGHVIAVKTSGTFHILCNGTKTNAVKSLRSILKQPAKPLPVILKNILSIQKLIILSKKEKELLTSEKHPFVLAKRRNLHRLEKERYKNILLSPHINPTNHRIAVALPPSPYYTALFEEISFPIICEEAKDNEGQLITEKDKLLEVYGNNFAFILDTLEEEDNTTRVFELYQIIYGKPKRIFPYTEIKTEPDTIEVHLDKEQSTISEYHFTPIKVLLDTNAQEQPKLSALSLLFSKLPLEEITALDLPFDTTEIKKLYSDWEKEINTKESHSLLTLFDAVAALSGKLYEKSFEKESILLAEGAFEVCEEDLFKYKIENQNITIDIISEYLRNNSLKHLASTLVNTISTIITQIAQEKQQNVTLKGDLFQFRDLTELTIEKLEDENIVSYY